MPIVTTYMAKDTVHPVKRSKIGAGPQGHVRSYLRQDPSVLTLPQFCLVPDKPWGCLPTLDPVISRFDRLVLPVWELFSNEQHREFVIGSDNSQDFASSFMRLGALIVHIDSHMQQYIRHHVWQLNSICRYILHGARRDGRGIPHRQSQQGLSFHRHNLSWDTQQHSSHFLNDTYHPVEQKQHRYAVKLAAQTILKNDASNRGSSVIESHGHDSTTKAKQIFMPQRIPSLAMNVRDINHEKQKEDVKDISNKQGSRFSSRDYAPLPIVGKLPELFVRNVASEEQQRQTRPSRESRQGTILYEQPFGFPFVEDSMTKLKRWDEWWPQRNILEQIQNAHPSRGNEQRRETFKTRNTIVRLLSMKNKAGKKEARTHHEQHHMLQDLQTKIEVMGDLNRSDLQMIRHMIQTLAEKFDRQQRNVQVPRMKPWSFYGPL